MLKQSMTVKWKKKQRYQQKGKKSSDTTTMTQIKTRTIT